MLTKIVFRSESSSRNRKSLPFSKKFKNPATLIYRQIVNKQWTVDSRLVTFLLLTPFLLLLNCYLSLVTCYLSLDSCHLFTCHLLPVTCYFLLATFYCYLLLVTGYSLLVTGYPLLVTHYLLPVNRYLLLVTPYLLLILVNTCYLLFILARIATFRSCSASRNFF